jgi:N utilization substance protein A
MSNPEMIDALQALANDKGITLDTLLSALADALESAYKRLPGAHEYAWVTIDPESVAFRVFAQELDEDGEPIGDEFDVTPDDFGRIAAQTAKQVMTQRIREAEREMKYEEYAGREGDIVTGIIQQTDQRYTLLDLGRVEALLPQAEQVPYERPDPGGRVKAYIVEVRKTVKGPQIVVSRTHPGLIKRLFELEVPEIADGVVEIKACAREPGHRTKIAVSSIDSKVDAVGACVGVRGSRIKNIVDELGGEKIDIVRWNESSQILIQNSLKPAEVVEISLCFELGRATVVVNEDQLSLAIGKRGQNVRLAARLTQWDVDILTPVEFTKSLDIMEDCLKGIEGISEDMIDKLGALGVISVFDIDEVGIDYLMETLGIDRELGQKVIDTASERAKVVAEQQQRDKEEAERRRREGEAQLAELPGEQQAAAVLGDILGGERKSPTSGGSGGGGGGDIVNMLENRNQEAESTSESVGQTNEQEQADQAG